MSVNKYMTWLLSNCEAKINLQGVQVHMYTHILTVLITYKCFALVLYFEAKETKYWLQSCK